jgi:AcrR family transcriptional regulator
VKDLSGKEFARTHAIGRAAATVFCNKGYLEASIDDVAAEAGLSKGAIYYYFSSKRELLFFILDTYVDGLLDGLEEQLKALPPGVPRVEFIARRHIQRYNAKVPEARTLLVDLHNLPAKGYRIVAAKQKRYAKILADALADFFDGKMPLMTRKAIAYILFGMCNSVMLWHDPDGPLAIDEVTDMCIQIFLKGANHVDAPGAN